MLTQTEKNTKNTASHSREANLSRRRLEGFLKVVSDVNRGFNEGLTRTIMDEDTVGGGCERPSPVPDYIQTNLPESYEVRPKKLAWMSCFGYLYQSLCNQMTIIVP